MWRRFSIYDVRVIGHYLGILTLFFSLVLAVPLITALVCQEWVPATHYLTAIGVSLIVGSLLSFLRVDQGRLDRQQALAVTGLSWILLAFIATIPLYMSGHFASYLDALFDGVSGLTTTGASLILDLDHLAYSDNMWRFMMHLIGGLGLIVIALSLGLFGRGAGSLYASEGRSEHMVSNVIQTTRLIAKIAIAFILVATTILTIVCVFLGMAPIRAFFHALWLSITGFITGGFAPTSDSVAYYHSFIIDAILMLLMILGAINFVLHTEVWRGRISAFFRDLEIRTMVLWLAVMTCVFAAALTASIGFNDLPSMLRSGLFMIIAAFTTTGLQTVSGNELTTVFSSGAFIVLAVLMAVGASAGSTAGGIKFNRIGIIVKSVIASIKEALAPDSARVVVSYNHVGRRMLTTDIVREAMMVFILYVSTYVVGALVGIAHGYEAVPSLFEAIAMASNGGLSSGLASAGMPPILEVFYMAEMWAGRLEFVTLLALIVEIVVSCKPRRRRKKQEKAA